MGLDGLEVVGLVEVTHEEFIYRLSELKIQLKVALVRQ